MTDRDKLRELIRKRRKFCNNKNCGSCGYAKFGGYPDCQDKMLAHNLIENGAIVPPCKVGDTVYTRYDHLSHKQTNEMLECKVVFIGFGEDGNHINIVDNYGHLHSMNFEIFDKTVFLNREEAAKELRRSKR